MGSMLAIRRIIVAAGSLLVLIPTNASAQTAGSGIAGTVRDASGGVLPGVTVEAASPALIEKARTVFTDADGLYNIVDLRPGDYVVTFTLAGFNTIRREGIRLTAGFTATVNADLPLGALEETITVTGASPLVDTRNVRQQSVITSELLETLPSAGKGIGSLIRLIPGMTGGSDSGGASGIYSSNTAATATVHGKGSFKLSYDGMQTNNMSGTGNVSYVINPATVQETTIETGGISAESNASGGSVNMVPREGGNLFSFSLDGMFSNDSLQGTNLSDDLLARGVSTTNKVLNLYDVNPTAGGPLRRDRLWFFAATRFSGSKNQVPGVYFNKTQGTPFYTPDLDRPAFRKEWLKSQALRLTWQLSPRNKLNAFADVQSYHVRGRGAFTAPESHSCWDFASAGLYQVSWSAPLTSRFLLEAGASLTRGDFPCTREQLTDIFGFVVSPTDVSILEATTGFRYNAAAGYSNKNDHDRYAQRLSVSYVTGSHTFKAGMQLQQGVLNTDREVNNDVNYTFVGGIPAQITQWATPWLQKNRMKADLGVFVQDQWVFRRLTLNYGLRLDYFNGYVPEQHVPSARFIGSRDFAPVHKVPEWTDLNPRVGGSYNLFGDGRTALKASLGRYVSRQSMVVATSNNPIATSINSVNRAWNDANGDYIPDCNLANFAANGECGPISNANFGKINPGATRYADDLIRGFGKRDYFWDFAAEVQHEMGSGISLQAGYYRNWTDHFGCITGNCYSLDTGVVDNLAVTPADHSPYCITAPVDSRLPGGGGYQVCGLYDIAPGKFGQGELLVTRASNYDNGKSRTSDFVGASVRTRLGPGVELGGSVDTGRTVEDHCFVIDSPQQLLHCRFVAPFKAQTSIKMHGTYPLPAGLVISGVLQNVSGAAYQANYAVRNDAIAPSLGRNLAACGTQTQCRATVTVPLVAPWTLFEPRRTQLDLRLSKVFTLGPRKRLRANLDVYNVLNDASVLEPNNNYGAFWRQPAPLVGGAFSGGLMDARLVQLGGQLTF